MTRITEGTTLRSPDGDEQSPTRHRLRRWAGVAAVATTGAVLAVSGLTADAGDEAAARSRTEAPAAAPTRHVVACLWTTNLSGRVDPADIAGAPTPESVPVAELCGGRWTGDLAWLVGAPAPTESSATPGCPRPGSAGSFLPGSHNVPIC